MNRLTDKMPAILLAGGVMAGVAGFADTVANQYFDTDLGLRGALPEPFDIPNHGMSWFAGTAIAAHYFHKSLRREYPEALEIAANNGASTQERHKSVSDLRSKVSGAAVGAIAAGSFWVVAGEVGSEVLHATYNNKQADVPAEQTEPLSLGRFDVLDLLYGIGPTVALVRLKRREHQQYSDQLEATLPPLKTQPKHKPSNKPQPKANKRYTPPKRKS